MKKIKTIIISLLLVCISFFTSIGAPIVTAFADDSSSTESTTIEYTSPLEDLEKSGDFDKNTYPVKADDYSLSVITVAESENLQLFVYVYQPSYGTKSLVASSINISRELHNRLSFRNYKLSLLGVDGVFQKYVVDGLVVNSDEVRYYEIASIFRVWDSTIDEGLEPTNENTIDEVVFKVAKQYTIAKENGVTKLHVSDTEVIEITDKYVGFIRYDDGFKFWDVEGGCDSHFIAFSTDKPIDKLYEADVYFETQHYLDVQSNDTISVGMGFGSPKEGYAYLDYKDEGEYTGDGWFANTYTFSRISTVSDFIDEVEGETIYNAGILNVTTTTTITDEGMEDLEGKQWVLRFAETAYEYYDNSIPMLGVLDKKEEFTIITDATILRLSFETDGVPYNLGVVDNKQSGSTTPDNETEISIELAEEWWQKLVALLLGVALLVVIVPFLVPILSTVFGLIFNGIVLIIKIIFNILTFPLRLIGKLFTKK